MNTSKLVLAAVVTAGVAFAATDISYAKANTLDMVRINAQNSDGILEALTLNAIEPAHEEIRQNPPEFAKTAQLRKARRTVRIAKPRRIARRRSPAANHRGPGSFQNQGSGPQPVGLLLPAVQAAREAARPTPVR